ncbi:MAG: hypothetical protein ACREQ5_17730 [Candidatus Dormibacteria bacterium]
MMRILILLASLIATMPSVAFADYFQFFDGPTSKFIPNAHIKIGNQAFGYTDAYGRIRIDIAPGIYQVQIESQDGIKTAQLHIDGGTKLKRTEAH